MTAKMTGALKEKKEKKVAAPKVVSQDGSHVHLPDGVFLTPRDKGDAPKSGLLATDLHPVSMDEAMEKHGVAEWEEPFPTKGVVRVAFTVQTPIAGKWYSAGEETMLPAELAHSLHKQITKAPSHE